MNLRQIQPSLSMVYRTLVRRETPVIVYTPGRVGSMSVLAAIRKAGLLGYKVESFTQEKLHSVSFCKKHIIEAGRPAKIVTLVRDPIEILISLYFSKLKHLPPVDRTNVSALQTHFVTHMLEGDKYHNQYLRWFETEFEPMLNINVFEQPFDIHAKHATIDHDRFPTLIVRLDLPNEIKSQVISNFLEAEVCVETSNVKTKDPVYVAFKQSLQLPKEYVEQIYALPYTQHFFTQDEIGQLSARWTT